MLLKYFSIAHCFCCDMDCTTAVSLTKWQLIWPEHSGFKSRLNFIFTLWFSIWLEADQETSINWFYGNNPKGCKPKHESDPDRLACGSKLLYQTNFFSWLEPKDHNRYLPLYLCFSFVQVAEEYRLVPDTLYLTVNYIDRYLSGNEINRQRLQLLGVACMLIAA